MAKAGVKKALDGVEPYKGGKGETLTQIAALNNADKHRLLFTIALGNPAIDIGTHFMGVVKNQFPAIAEGLKGTAMEPLWAFDADQSPLVAGRELFIEPLGVKPNDDMKFKFEVALNEPSIVAPQPFFPLLPNMVQLVESIIPAFKGFV